MEYGRLSPDGVDVVDTRRVGEPADPSLNVSSESWRSVVVAGPGSPSPARGQVLRLVAVDDRTDLGGWLAFSAPRVSPFVPVDRLIPDGAPTAVGWQFAFLFPCLRQPRVTQGITEPATWAVAYGSEPLKPLLRDLAWVPGRGGVSGQTGRQAAITQLTTRVRDAPEITTAQVYQFRQPFATDAYRLTPSRRTVPGWSVDPPDSP